MLPPISAIASIELIRDGGSLQAMFVGINGSKYCLYFQLIAKEGSSGELVRLGYEHPIVFERLEFREQNRDEWQAIDQVEVSWTHANVLLHQLGAYPQSDEDSKWLAAMREVASAEGQIPHDMPHALATVRCPRHDA